MKKLIIYALMFLFVLGCNEYKKQRDDTVKKPTVDTVAQIESTSSISDTLSNANRKSSLASDTALSVKINKDTLLLLLQKQILTAIKNKDYEKFAGFIHPVEGVRFSPYAFITGEDVKFKPEEFLNKVKQKQQKIIWGSYDGSGDPIALTIEGYFKRFVYDVDFLHAKEISVNKMHNSGNSLNNLKEVYPSAELIENYFPGFEKKYEGMDWRILRLVFKKYKENYCLVGIVHDEWTI